MGTWATAKRSEIDAAFEAASGDMRGDVEPVFLVHRDGGEDAVTGEKTIDRTTMNVDYQILDPALDDDDVARIFAVAYLDVFTDNYYRDKVATIALRNRATGAARTFPNH